MPDIFLRVGAANPNDVRLRDPTLPDATTVLMEATTLSGIGALAATPLAIVIAVATNGSGIGSLASTSLVRVLANATNVTGTGALSSSSVLTTFAAATNAAGAGTLSAAPMVLVPAALTTVTGAGALGAVPLVVVLGAGTNLPAVGLLVSGGTIVVMAPTTLVMGTGLLSGEGVVLSREPPRRPRAATTNRRSNRFITDAPATIRSTGTSLSARGTLNVRGVVLVEGTGVDVLKRLSVFAFGTRVIPAVRLGPTQLTARPSLRASSRLEFIGDEELLELVEVLGVLGMTQLEKPYVVADQGPGAWVIRG